MRLDAESSRADDVMDELDGVIKGYESVWRLSLPSRDWRGAWSSASVFLVARKRAEHEPAELGLGWW